MNPKQLLEEAKSLRTAATADYEKAKEAAGDDESGLAEAKQAYAKAMRAVEAKIKEHDEALEAKTDDWLESIEQRLENAGDAPDPLTPRQPSGAASRSHRAAGWDEAVPASFQVDAVIRASGESLQEEARVELAALDAWMSVQTEYDFENAHPEMVKPLRALRAATDNWTPDSAADGGVYIPDMVIPQPSTDRPAQNLVEMVTVHNSVSGKGRLPRTGTTNLVSVDTSTPPANQLGDAAVGPAFNCQDHYANQNVHSSMLSAPGTAKAVRDSLMLSARMDINAWIINGVGDGFAGIADGAKSGAKWTRGGVTIADVLATIGELDVQKENFPPNGLAWVVTKPTFYNSVLPLDITAQKGQLTAIVNPASINGTGVFFHARDADGGMDTFSSAATDEVVAVHGNFKHYAVVFRGRPRITRRPLVNYEEFYTRFRAVVQAAGVIADPAGFVTKVKA